MKRTTILFCLLALCAGTMAQQQMTNSGNFYLHPGATMTLYGDVANNGTFTDTGQMVTFAGTSAQTLSGSSPTTFNRVTLNNAAGLTLQQNIEVNTGLTLTSGPLHLNGNTVTVNNTSVSAIIRTSGYIVSEQTDNSGKIKWKIDADTGAHIYPLGTATGTYIPFTLALDSGNIGYVTVSTYPTAANNTPYPVSPVTVTTMNNPSGSDNSAHVVDRFWQIDKDGASGTATLTFTAAAAETGGIIDLKAQRWNAALSAWDAPLPSQTSTTTTVTVPSVSAFSPWTLSGNSSSLPIELLSFTAVAVDNQTVDLNWITATETNNDYFTVERSIDGMQYEEVVVVNGAGNSSSVLYYKATDNNPYNGISYYRLKQTDTDGEYGYSNIEVVKLEKNTAPEFGIFPNPSDGTQVNIRLSCKKGTIHLDIHTAQGLHRYNKVWDKQDEGPETHGLVLDKKLAPGVYTVTITLNKERYCKRLIVQ